ncbi:unnamed protein product [Haemonchus placei]|uniref:Fatty acyl-CoA reductase n=1 Tax=Haemonchus placei TaxID=6290 RepID=A0A0N4XB47_HAEPC|nr:unnamed protein product [Haemonchus placei]
MSWRVEDVYCDRSILLTGSTGFLGKVLVEKILWALPNVGQIFLLIRPANGLSPKERLEKVLQVWLCLYFSTQLLIENL